MDSVKLAYNLSETSKGSSDRGRGPSIYKVGIFSQLTRGLEALTKDVRATMIMMKMMNGHT